MINIKILSVRQPWAHLIVTGAKDVENRTWKTDYRGTLIIHASKKIDKQAYADLVSRGVALPPMDELRTGALIGAAMLMDCIQDSNSEWADPEKWHWMLARQGQFESYIPYKGALGLQTIAADEYRAMLGMN